MDLNHLRLFVRVIEAGSLSEAARRLGVSKSNLSRALSALEKELGVQLVYRNTRSFSATDSGLHLYEQCRGLLYEIQRAAESVAQDTNALKGVFTLTSAVDLAYTILPSIMSDFAKTHRQLQIEIRAEDRVVDLVKEGVDLALRMGELSDSALKATKIGEVSLILVASPQYVAAQGKVRTVEHLAEHAYISFNKKFEKKLQLLKRGGKRQSVSVSNRLKANNPLLAKELVLQGQGISLLPDFICYEEIKSGRMVRVLPDFASEASPVHFVWPAKGAESPKVRAFIDFSKDTLRKYFINSGVR